MDQFTQWDLDVPGAGSYTAWDAPAGDPTETKWDLLPSILGRGVTIVWQQLQSAWTWIAPWGVRW